MGNKILILFSRRHKLSVKVFAKSPGFHQDALILQPASKIAGTLGGTKVQIVINVINCVAGMINLSEKEELMWLAKMPSHAFRVAVHARLNYAN